jgi:hypothetical protein
MKMKKTVGVYDFRDYFFRSDTYKNNFSYDGLTALYDYLIEFEEDRMEELELDVCGFCCTYAEYSIAEYNDDYNTEYKNMEEIEENLDYFACKIDSESFIAIQH